MEDVTAARGKGYFSEAAWKKAYQSIEETFPKRTVQGWFICGAPGCIFESLLIIGSGIPSILAERIN